MLNGINRPSCDFVDWTIKHVDGTLGPHTSIKGKSMPPVQPQFLQHQRAPVQQGGFSMAAPQQNAQNLPTYVTALAQAQQCQAYVLVYYH